MAYTVMAYTVMAYTVMAYVDIALYGYCLIWSWPYIILALYSYGPI